MVICFALGTNVQGVYANWTYSSASLNPTNQAVGVKLAKWDSLTQLPQTDEGTSHTETIDKVTDGPDGLNNNNSFINQQLADRINGNKDSFGSYDYHNGAEANNLFGSTDGKMNFIIQAPKNDPKTRYLFTTKVDIGKEGNLFVRPVENIPRGEYVYIIYRTTLKQDANNQWVQDKAEIGAAKAAFYDNKYAGSALVKTPAFDPKTWVAGKRGLDKNAPVYSYVGQETSAILDNKTQKAYYKIVPKTAGTVTVTITEKADTCKANVYDANMKLLNATAGAQGTKTVSFSVSKDVTYIIEVSGNDIIAFNIK